MEQLIILDWSTSEVHIYNISNDSNINNEYIKNELGFDINYCSWMFGENIKIVKHNKILK